MDLYALKRIKILYSPYKKIKNHFESKKRNIAIKEYGYKMLDDVCQNLKKSDLTVFCAYGTLLGFVRDNGFISYDLDIDMGVIDDDFFSWEKLDDLLRDSGLKLHHQFVLDDGTITERTYYVGDATIDFFLFKKHKNYMSSLIYEREKYSKKFFVRVSEVPLIKEVIYIKKKNIEVPIIKNYEEFLVKVYGENWKYPDPNFKHDERILDNRYAKMEFFKK